MWCHVMLELYKAPAFNVAFTSRLVITHKACMNMVCQVQTFAHILCGIFSQISRSIKPHMSKGCYMPLTKDAPLVKDFASVLTFFMAEA